MGRTWGVGGGRVVWWCHKWHVCRSGTAQARKQLLRTAAAPALAPRPTPASGSKAPSRGTTLGWPSGDPGTHRAQSRQRPAARGAAEPWKSLQPAGGTAIALQGTDRVCPALVRAATAARAAAPPPRCVSGAACVWPLPSSGSTRLDSALDPARPGAPFVWRRAGCSAWLKCRIPGWRGVRMSSRVSQGAACNTGEGVPRSTAWLAQQRSSQACAPHCRHSEHHPGNAPSPL